MPIVPSWERVAETLPHGLVDLSYFEAIVEHMPVFIGIVDKHGYVKYMNKTARDWMGLGKEPINPDWRLSPVEMEIILRSNKEGVWQGEREHFLARWPQRTKNPTVLQTIVAHKDDSGEVQFYSTIAKDISNVKRLEQERVHLLNVIEETPAAVCTVDTEGRFLYLNQAARDVLGIGADDDISFKASLGIYTSQSIRLLLDEALPIASRQGQWDGETELITPSGETLRVMQSIVAHRDTGGHVLYYSTIIRDITERKLREERLQYEATHDALTGAVNRAHLHEQLHDELARAKSKNGSLAALQLDLDKFKQVNDRFGHHVGDLVLNKAVRVLQQRLRDTDILARTGGDEFVIVLPQTTRRQAKMIGHRLLEALASEIVQVNKTEVSVQGSIGIAMYPDDATTVDKLLMYADMAMYAAKRDGGNQLRDWPAG